MIYLDNAATSFPKPPEVIRAMAGVEEKMGANPGRGGHRLALRAGRVVEHCREEAARLLGVHHPERILFTANCTEALNLAISGTLRRGDEVICSYAEHNAVMRLLDRYVSRGEITVHMLAPDERGILSPASLRRVISRKTALVIIAHASNVTGLIQPIAQLGAVCRERGVPLLVDAAQTAGARDRVFLDRAGACRRGAVYEQRPARAHDPHPVAGQRRLRSRMEGGGRRKAAAPCGSGAGRLRLRNRRGRPNVRLTKGDRHDLSG